MKTIIYLFIFFLSSIIVLKAQNWPSYSGPTYNHVASYSDTTEILTDENYITKEWQSADTFGLWHGRDQAPRYSCGNYNEYPDEGYSTHCASLIVYDGKVYQYFLDPVGPHYDQTIVDDHINNAGCDSALVYKQLELWSIEAKDRVLCLDANTGEKLWKTSFDGLYRYDWAKPRGANNTICAANGNIYGYTSMGKVFCIDASTGSVQWETNNWSWKVNELNSSISNNQFTGQCLLGSATVYADGVVLFAVNNTLYAHDASDGTELWTKNNATGNQQTPTVWEYNGNTYIICGNLDGDVYCLDAQTGSQQWALSGLGGNHKDIIVNDNYMMCYVEGEHKKNTQQKIGVYQITDTDATHLWTHNELTPNNSSPGVIANGLVFKSIESQLKLKVFDVQTGTILAETGLGISGHMFYYVDGKIFTETDSHHPGSNSYVVYEANADTVYKLFGWKPPHDLNSAYEWSWTHPIINGKMYMRGTKRIHCYNFEKKVKNLGSVQFIDKELSLLTGETHLFKPKILDQYGVEYNSSVTVTFNVLGEGYIEQDGNYTASSIGGIVDTVIVSVSEPGKEVKDTAYVTVKQSQHISCPQLDSVYYLQEPFRLACNASSGFPVVYEKVSGPFYLSGDTVNLLGVAGTAYISVTQPGNEIYDAAPSVMYTFIISYTEPDDTIPEVSVEEVQNNKVDVYPNPTNGVITVVSGQSLNVKVFNMLGSEITNREILNSFKNKKEITIDLTSQPDGIYILKMGNMIKKIVKKQ